MQLRSVTLLASVVLAAGGTPAMALSCDGRLDAAAKAICADPAIESADDRMSSAFEQLRAGLDASKAAMLLDDQRDWLTRRNGVCDGSDEPAGACLRRWDEARSRDLRGEAASGPGTKGRLEPVVVVRPGDPRTMERRLLWFRFVDPVTPGQAAFNALVGSLASRTSKDASVDPGSKGTYLQRATIAYASPDLISIRVDGSEFVAGAAHGMSWTDNVNFDLRSGKRMLASDVLDANGLGQIDSLCATQVAAQVRANFKANGQDPARGGQDAKAFQGEVADMRKDLDKVTADASHWQFGADSLIVTYDQDAVASHAEGAFSCEVPYTSLRGLARPGFPVPAGGAVR